MKELTPKQLKRKFGKANVGNMSEEAMEELVQSYCEEVFSSLAALIKPMKMTLLVNAVTPILHIHRQEQKD